jgi:integrase/recombinase XerD
VEDAIGRFLNYLTVEKGFSENTIAAYRNDLNQLAIFIGEEAAKRGSIPPWAIFGRQGMLSYLLNLKERNYAPTTVARKVAAAKSFFNFMVAEGIIKDNPAQNVGSPKVGKSLPNPISISQVRLLLEQPTKLSTTEAKRDRAMLELLYASGMRVSELVSLNLGDVDVEGGYVRCFGKGHKERLIPIYEQAALAVGEYIKEARPRLVRNDDERALFVNRRGDRLTRQGFWQILSQFKNYWVTPISLPLKFTLILLVSMSGAPMRNPTPGLSSMYLREVIDAG